MNVGSVSGLRAAQEPGAYSPYTGQVLAAITKRESPVVAAPTLASIFARISGGDDTITFDDVKDYALRAGVGGFMGDYKRQKVAEEFMKQFDVDGNGSVNWDEGRKKVGTLIKDINFFDEADGNKDGTVTKSELYDALLAVFEQDGQGQASIRADITTKLTLYFHPEWHSSEQISRSDYVALMEDIRRQTQGARPAITLMPMQKPATAGALKLPS